MDAANAGQVCVAPDYALVHESRHDEFVAALGAAFRRMYDAEGHGFDQSKELLRIVNDAHFARVQGLLDDARTRARAWRWAARRMRRIAMSLQPC